MGFVLHWNESAMGLHVFPILIKHLLCARDCGYSGEQKQLSPCYHGTDSVAEETAITDVCVCVYVCVCVCVCVCACVWNSTSGEGEGVREHRAISPNHSSNLMEGFRFSEEETCGTWEMSRDWPGEGANVFKSWRVRKSLVQQRKWRKLRIPENIASRNGLAT